MQPGPPEASEYASYYGKYTTLVPTGDIVGTLESQLQTTLKTLANVREDRGDYRYAPGKWSIKDVIGHMSDAERIFVYRALRIARGDRTPIEAFEQDDYVLNGGFDSRTLSDMVAEFTSVRAATLTLFRTLTPEAWVRSGIANQQEVSVRALAYIIAGHEIHHRNVLEASYLAASAQGAGS